MNDIKKSDAREYNWTPITIEELGTHYLYRARLARDSTSSVYFETDLLLYRGTKVYIGIEDPAHRLFPEDDENFLVEIIWRNRLSESLFNYGYKAKVTVDNAEKELRKSPRKNFSKPTYFKFKNKYYQGATKNINRSGAFVISGAKFSNGDELKFVVLGTKKYVLLKGEIVHSNPTGFGVKFKNLLKVEKFPESNSTASN